MIDFIYLSLFFALDQAAVAKLGKSQLPYPPDKLYKRELRLAHWASKVIIEFDAQHIRLAFCPNKILGVWNATGSDDLRDWVRTLVPLILQEAGHALTSKEMHQLRFRHYRLHEVHIANAFLLLGVDQREFVTNVGNVLGRRHLIEWLNPGVGFRIRPRSRYVQHLCYSKLHETLDQGRPRMGKVFAALGRNRHPWTRAAFAHQLNHAAAGPRWEVRLRDKFFAKSKFADGRNWDQDTASQLFAAKLLALELPDGVRVVPARGLAESRLKSAVLSTFVHWANGEDLTRLVSATTLKRHREAIAEAMGIDIRYSAADVFGSKRDIEVGAVLHPGNIVPLNFDAEAEGCEEAAYQYMTIMKTRRRNRNR